MIRRSVFALLVAWSFLLSASGAPEQGGRVWIHNGFQTGSSYRNLDAYSKRVYAMGYVDALLVSGVFGANPTKVQWVANCVTPMSDEQLAAIFEKWVNDHPAKWNENMHVLAYLALIDACPK